MQWLELVLAQTLSLSLRTVLNNCKWSGHIQRVRRVRWYLLPCWEFISLTSSCVTITCWRMLLKWWQCSNIAAFTAFLEHPIMESASILIEKTTDFIALLCSPIFMSALLCDHSFVLKALCSTNWSSTSFCGQGLSPVGPCAPHNNTLKPAIRGHLAPGPEGLYPLLGATHAHTHDIYHSLMTDSTKHDVTGRNTTTYNKRVAVPLSS